MSNARQNNLNAPHAFFRQYYRPIMLASVITILLMLLLVNVVIYQVSHRPLPLFFGVTTNGKEMSLKAYNEPNLLPDTILRWANKVAVAAYTFDFVNFRTQLDATKPYFTEAGWIDYRNSLVDLLQTITKNKLFVNGVVAGTPVIASQGDIPGRGYVWRVQMPFLVTYQSSETVSRESYTVILTILKISTAKNPSGIAVDQFVMV